MISCVLSLSISCHTIATLDLFVDSPIRLLSRGEGWRKAASHAHGGCRQTLKNHYWRWSIRCWLRLDVPTSSCGRLGPSPPRGGMMCGTAIPAYQSDFSRPFVSIRSLSLSPCHLPCPFHPLPLLVVVLLSLSLARVSFSLSLSFSHTQSRRASR